MKKTDKVLKQFFMMSLSFTAFFLTRRKKDEEDRRAVHNPTDLEIAIADRQFAPEKLGPLLKNGFSNFFKYCAFASLKLSEDFRIVKEFTPSGTAKIKSGRINGLQTLDVISQRTFDVSFVCLKHLSLHPGYVPIPT